MSLKEFWEMLEIKGKGEKTKQNKTHQPLTKTSQRIFFLRFYVNK